MKILDIAGLQYFWTKIKALLSGKADDGDVVHKAGAETVSGLKTFSGELQTATSSVVHGLEIRDPSTDREQTYNVNHISQILFCDVNGNYYSGENDHHRLGLLQFNKSSIDNHVMQLRVYKQNNNVIDFSGLSIGITNTHIKYATAPSTPNRNDDTDIITRDWIPQDERIVHTTGDETISGNKTFTDNLTVSRGTPLLRIKSSGASNSYRDVRFLDKDDAIVAAIRSSAGESLTIGTRAASGSWLAGSLLALDHAGTFTLKGSDGTVEKSLVGSYDGTLLWNGQPVQTSSDERVKTRLSGVPDSVLDLWEDVEWGQFQYLDAVKEKGSSARLHVGLIAQQVIAAFGKKDSDACAYGILCHEVHDASPEVLGKNGEVVTPAKDAVDLWMARYTEALCMEAAWQRRENARLKKRIADLEERLAALELKIS